MIKNILAAIGAVTVGAIALGAVIGHCAVTTANDDDFDLEKDLRKARDYCRKKAEELDEEEEDDEEGEGEPQMCAMPMRKKSFGTSSPPQTPPAAAQTCLGPKALFRSGSISIALR